MGQLEINASHNDGGEETYDETDVMNELAKAGQPVHGVTPDGLSIIGTDSQGQMQKMPIQQVMKKLGWTVNNITPKSPDDSTASPEWAAIVSSMHDDDQKRSFLEAKMKREGYANPEVYGKGDDWHIFDPQMGQWKSLTSTKNTMGMANAAHYLPAAVRMAGGIVGAGAGAAGSIPGMMAGGAIGQGGAEAAMQGVMALDPEYRNQMQAGQTLGNVAEEAAAGGIGAGIGGAAVKLGGPILSRLASPITSAGRGLSGAAEAVGNFVGKAGNFMGGGPIRQDIAAQALVPHALTAQTAGMALQAPEWLTKVAPKVAGWFGKSGMGKSLMGEEGAQGLSEEAARILQSRSGQAEATGKDVIMNAMDKLKNRSMNQVESNWEHMSPEEIEEALKKYASSSDTAASVGDVIDSAARLGRGIDSTVRGAGRVGAGALGKMGNVAEAVGGAAKKGFNFARPLEPTLALQRALGLSEENLLPSMYRKPAVQRLRGKSVVSNNEP